MGQDAEEAAIKRAKRTLSLATHPDKIGDAPGANEAFNLVTEVRCAVLRCAGTALCCAALWCMVCVLRRAVETSCVGEWVVRGIGPADGHRQPPRLCTAPCPPCLPTACSTPPSTPQACEVLGDAAKRREYDTELASAASFGPGFT